MCAWCNQYPTLYFFYFSFGAYAPKQPVTPGGHSELEPRLPIPNRTVKRLCADDSVDYPCESRSPPGTLYQNPFENYRSKGFLFAGTQCANIAYLPCSV